NEGKQARITLDLAPAAATLPPPLALTLFRVAQEAIRNALRHADARHIRVELQCDATEVTLRVADDGIGFSVPARLGGYAEAGHFGLVGMTERIDHVGGILSVSSTVDGTAIDVRAPMPAGSRCGA
ncbi:MAG TPA: ATP-binding protein, partial [Thermomicrobiales bacterium]|nr:ATP-binding protein [Thermomicrobiales bacterium]